MKIYSVTPRTADLISHDVDLIESAKPVISQHPYGVNHEKIEKMKDELKYIDMKENDITQPSSSDKSSSCVSVQKNMKVSARWYSVDYGFGIRQGRSSRILLHQ